MANNIRVSITALALGITWGLGTLVLLFYNVEAARFGVVGYPFKSAIVVFKCFYRIVLAICSADNVGAAWNVKN